MFDQTSASQRQRQRKFHRRSRNACIVYGTVVNAAMRKTQTLRRLVTEAAPMTDHKSPRKL
ncbi:hypothetical protein PG989_009243 [Apiospora arundinis]